MGTRLRGVCDAFEVTVDEPRRGDRELNVDVVFAPDGPTDRAIIELRMYARDLGPMRFEGSWDREAPVPGTRANLLRGKTGRLRFTRPLPAFVTSYLGKNVELAPVLVTEGDDGSKLRLQLEVPQVAEDAWLVVRGLPRSESLRSKGLGGLLRGHQYSVHVDQLREGTVSVSVQGPRPLTRGHARLEAVEFRHDQEREYWETKPPIVSTEAALVAAGAGRLRAELPLPEARAAPASIECGPPLSQGVRWWARLELEGEGGDVARTELALHVGVERPD
jgi:hypothetical protein